MIGEQNDHGLAGGGFLPDSFQKPTDLLIFKCNLSVIRIAGILLPKLRGRLIRFVGVVEMYP